MTDVLKFVVPVTIYVEKNEEKAGVPTAEDAREIVRVAMALLHQEGYDSPALSFDFQVGDPTPVEKVPKKELDDETLERIVSESIADGPGEPSYEYLMAVELLKWRRSS